MNFCAFLMAQIKVFLPPPPRDLAGKRCGVRRGCRQNMVEVPLLLCFRSPVYCWRRCKRLCHPHSWNVMHAVHRVCFKREVRSRRRRGASLEETGCSRWGPPLHEERLGGNKYHFQPPHHNHAALTSPLKLFSVGNYQ